MFRSQAQKQKIERQATEIADLREKVSRLRGELTGERHGKHIVTEQLARDLHLGALREEQHRARAAQAYGDMQTAMRIVAGHVLDCQKSGIAPVVATANLLDDALESAGVSLRPALIAAAIARADASARTSADQSAAAIATSLASAGACEEPAR